MIESLLGLLAFLVFGVFWLSSQEWFDVLPRRVMRQVGHVGLAILLVTAYLAPSAFQSGLQRWVTYVVDAAQEKYEGFVEGVVENIKEAPTSTPPPPASTTAPAAP